MDDHLRSASADFAKPSCDAFGIDRFMASYQLGKVGPNHVLDQLAKIR